MTDGERKILAAPPPSAAPAPPPPALAIRFAELADVGTLVGLINAAYASSEGELWEEVSFTALSSVFHHLNLDCPLAVQLIN